MASVLDLIIALRGRHPDNCDWCSKPLGNHPVPEEAGQWICRDCEKTRDTEPK